MSDGEATSKAKTRQQIEQELLEALQLRQNEWIVATDGERTIARQRFLDALQVFNGMILYNKPPTDSKL